MADLHLHISAIDSLMFRDGRPFNQNDAGASMAVSVFPPYPPTLVGAVRAALWQGPLKGIWCSEKLGNGTNWQKKDDKQKEGAENYLDPLSFSAPILLKGGKQVFPVPLHILEGADEAGEKQLTRLVPGKERNCDLGQVQLPVPEDQALEGIKTIEDRWVSFAGMLRILNGCVPYQSDLIPRTDLWQTEPRVGIGIKPDSRTTSDGQLYMASHVRMADGVSLYVEMTGWKGGLEKTLRPLAGEHRMAEVKTGGRVKLPNATSKNGKYCLIALSPVVPDENWDISGIDNSKIETACLGKPVSIGGWDSQAKTPIALRQCYPAGSVWFLKNGNLPAAIGEATEWGFGQVLVGKY